MDQRIEDLIEWTKAGGARFPDCLEFRYTDTDGFAAYKVKQAHASESTITLPLSLAILPETSLSEFQLTYEDLQSKNIHPNSLTKLFLCKQRTLGDDSPLKIYIKSLPSGEEVGVPYYWTLEEQDLLKGTNLHAAMKLKLASVIDEWFAVVSELPQSHRPSSYFQDVNLYHAFKSGAVSDSVLHKTTVTTQLDKSFTSFTNYLWAHVILTSRSFPYDLVSKNNPVDGLVMVLPLLDLFNHEPACKVSWDVDPEHKKFSFTNDDFSDLPIGAQINNNYGPKGNEELLLNYGFCIEGSKTDVVALRIKLPLDNLGRVEQFGVKLHTKDEFTTFAFDTKYKFKEGDHRYEEFREGVTFLCNWSNLIPKDLFNLFCYLVKNDSELGVTNVDQISLRMKLEGLTQLRNALEAKRQVLQKTSLPQSAPLPDSTDQKVIARSIRNFNNARIYRHTQEKLYVAMIAELKHIEKGFLKEYRSKVVSLKSIWKKDATFTNSLLLSLGFDSLEKVEDSNFQDTVILLWIMRTLNREHYDKQDQAVLPEWLHNLKTKFPLSTINVETEPYKPLYEQLFPPLAERIPEVYAKGDWSLEFMAYAGVILSYISYTRGAKQECILVEPTQDATL
ncbi:hypothetical protein LJB42_003404 [Komagataella kurtzmanii]|nr:hypothetical protein LJB42_003404 [Komagataella kurtzmanii]